MKKGLNGFITVIVIIAGIYIGINLDKTNYENVITDSISTDPYKELRSDGKHQSEEENIKRIVDKYMYDNFGSVFKTSWYDSISASGAVINQYGKYFVIQSKSDSHNDKAKEYIKGLLSFFNSKTTDPEYLVDKVILVDQGNNIIYEKDTFKW
jgi:23S rRNA G2069 N7-methylase RlmK/C1962 C5-methylase RlmI